MASFQSLTAYSKPLNEFRSRTPKTATGKHDATTSGIGLHLFEWTESTTKGCERSGLRSAAELDVQIEGAVRVIFAPQDVPTMETAEGLGELFEKCGIPSAFLEESLQGVSQSFAAQEDLDGTTFVWFHLLCKTFKTNSPQGPELQKIGICEGELHREAQSQSQADFTWLKTGCVLKIRKQQGTSPQGPTRKQSSNSQKTLATTSAWPSVDLYCFGAPHTLHGRFQALADVATHGDLQQDPYLLLDIILEEIFRVMDDTGWAIADIFGDKETQTLDMASKPGKATIELSGDHFTGIHNLAKHTIYLRENCDAALTTLDDLRAHHKETFVGGSPSAAQRLTCQALKYRKTLFQSTQRRLTSLDARMANIIQLSFHIVTQGDSRLMQSENQSMKTIAVMTLIFMPLGTVAAIFGAQFMDLQDDSSHITVSKDFWLMWIIAIPLTILVLAIWWKFSIDARGRLIGEIKPRPKSEHGPMRWRTLRQISRAKNEKGSV